MTYSVLCNRYRGSVKLSQELVWRDDKQLSNLISVSCHSDIKQNGKKDTKITAHINQSVPDASLSVCLARESGDEKPYVFMPSALYDGNRFHCAAKPYPPMLTKEERSDFAHQPVISDVPRLTRDEQSFVQLSTGDMATPCVGYFSARDKVGYLLFFPQSNSLGNFGVYYKEEIDGKIKISLSSPCVREEFKYGMCTTKTKSDDKGAQLKADTELTFYLTEYNFPCESIAEFYQFFFAVRTQNGLKRSWPNSVPWSYAFSLIEEKYNRRNWLESAGFYKSSEATASIYRQWQTGWVGGAMNTLPCFALGTALSKERSTKTLDFVFTALQHPSGFLYGIFCDGKAYGDNFYNPENKSIVMSRKNADALYYLTKQLLYLEKSGQNVAPLWRQGLKKLADAFCSFYSKNGELGQFIDIEAEEIYIGSSASAGIAPAGLALCSVYFHKERYLTTAKELAERYYQNYIAKGITNGGPGEILSAPDSESAFGLLESYVVLYSLTNEKKWLLYAQDAAAFCASWCVSYDYTYERDTQFYKRKVATTGAVWANVQNKHAAPGICTLSGSSLFRLYRATGDQNYLALCKDITHNITQYVSTPDHPMRASYVWHNNDAHLEKRIGTIFSDTVFALHQKQIFKKPTQPLYNNLFNPVGRMNERVNLSDWEGKNNVGEVPLGSCWCEVSTMLTYLEIPSVYIQSDTAFVYPLDHVGCQITEKTTKTLSVSLTNPTQYDACYRLFIEKSTDCTQPIDDMCLQDFLNVTVKAKETIQINIERG